MTGPKDKDAFRSEAPTDPGCRDDEATAKNTNPFLERTTDMSREELLDLTQYDPELEELFEQPASAPALPPPPVHPPDVTIFSEAKTRPADRGPFSEAKTVPAHEPTGSKQREDSFSLDDSDFSDEDTFEERQKPTPPPPPIEDGLFAVMDGAQDAEPAPPPPELFDLSDLEQVPLPIAEPSIEVSISAESAPERSGFRPLWWLSALGLVVVIFMVFLHLQAEERSSPPAAPESDIVPAAGPSTPEPPLTTPPDSPTTEPASPENKPESSTAPQGKSAAEETGLATGGPVDAAGQDVATAVPTSPDPEPAQPAEQQTDLVQRRDEKIPRTPPRRSRRPAKKTGRANKATAPALRPNAPAEEVEIEDVEDVEDEEDATSARRPTRAKKPQSGPAPPPTRSAPRADRQPEKPEPKTQPASELEDAEVDRDDSSDGVQVFVDGKRFESMIGVEDRLENGVHTLQLRDAKGRVTRQWRIRVRNHRIVEKRIIP